MNYQVITDTTIDGLEEQVNFEISTGWNPIGSVITYTEKTKRMWAQAMVFK